MPLDTVETPSIPTNAVSTSSVIQDTNLTSSSGQQVLPTFSIEAILHNIIKEGSGQYIPKYIENRLPLYKDRIQQYVEKQVYSIVLHTVGKEIREHIDTIIQQYVRHYMSDYISNICKR